jgi:hypothetical protein
LALPQISEILRKWLDEPRAWFFFSWEYLDKLDALNAGIIEVSGWWIEIWQ